MKYRITWKDICKSYLLRHLLYGLPIFLLASFIVAIWLSLFNGNIDSSIFSQLLSAFINIWPVIIWIYILVVIILFFFSFQFWRKNIIGEHELCINKWYFIWKGHTQKVETSLEKLKKLKIRKKYFLAKFDGIRSAKIMKSWSISWYDEFVTKLEEEFRKRK